MSSKLRILSLGAGVQSSTLALMCEHGIIAKPDYAIFADTGWEPKHCYDWLDWLEKQLSFPVLRVNNGNIRKDLIANLTSNKRFGSIPFFVDGGIGKRQCTAEYKLKPIYQKARELLGYAARQRIPAASIDMLVGISLDEHQRMKPSQKKWIVNTYPLVDLRMSRNDCLSWMANNDYPTPPKSSCIGCPFHSNQHWREMKESDLDAWNDAVYIDHQLRANGLRGDMRMPEFMHRSCQPLEIANIGDEMTSDMINMFINECEGMCGV